MATTIHAGWYDIYKNDTLLYHNVDSTLSYAGGRIPTPKWGTYKSGWHSSYVPD